MTPKRILLASLALISISVLSMTTYANPPRFDEHDHDHEHEHDHDGRGGGGRDDGRHGDDHDDRGGYGPPRYAPAPAPYYPPAPSYPPPSPTPYPPAPYNPPPYPGDSQTVRTLGVGRWVGNEVLPLGSMLGLGYDPTIVIDSVVVNIRGGSAVLNLILDGRIVDSTNYAIGQTILYPRQLNCNASSLQLQVSGQVLINDITVTFHRNGGGYNPGPGYGEMRVPVNVYRRMIGNDRIDLAMYTNLNQYRGYRLVAIEFNASAVYNNALLSILINGFSQGDQIVDRFARTQIVYPSGVNPIIGAGVDSIVFSSRGDMDLQGVTLRLSR